MIYMFRAIRCCQLKYLRPFETCALKYMTLSFSTQGFAWQSALNKTKLKLAFLTDIDMLLMVDGGIRGGICHATYRYVKA